MTSQLCRYANEIYSEARLYSDQKDIFGARRAIFAACAGLRSVHDDLRPKGTIATAMRILRGRLADHREEVAEIVRDSDLFLNVFVSQEAQVLLRSGLRRDVVDLILTEAEALRGELLSFDGSPQELRERIEPLMRDVCEISESYPNYMAAGKTHRKNISIVNRAGWVVVGGLIVGTNGAIDVLSTGGMIPAATALSGVLGGHIMTKPL